ncbi:TPA: sce7726 family protein, partial [Yersinia enterocolitica]|nr:sce7726 family protein [Yersinia enterocolitica]HDL8726519.1 sce7726 family protein [Yersinia enterocolitica]
EIEIKIRLVEFLLKNSSNEIVIGSELRFNYGSRRADIVMLEKDIATVFEIKGSGDSVERLSYQIKSYKEYFDLCYIVCEGSNLKNVRKTCGREIGIILVTESEVSIIRESALFKRHNKVTLASTLSTNFLKTINENKKIKSKHELCESLARNKSLNEIRVISRKKLLEKLKPSFSLFIRELGIVVNPDDILTLTRMPSEKLSKRA